MSSLTLKLTKDQFAFVESQREARGFATAEEYLHDLIRQEQSIDMAEIVEENRQLTERMARVKAEQPDEHARVMAYLKKIIEEGLASGPGREMTPEAVNALRERFRNRSAGGGQ